MNNLAKIQYFLSLYSFAREKINHNKAQDNSCPLDKNQD